MSNGRHPSVTVNCTKHRYVCYDLSCIQFVELHQKKGEIIVKMCKTGKNPMKYYERLAGLRMSEGQ